MTTEYDTQESCELMIQEAGFAIDDGLYEAVAEVLGTLESERRVAAQMRIALRLCVECLPCLEVRNWPPGWRLKPAAIAAAKAALAVADAALTKAGK